jgi:chromosome segregation ATPase
MEESPSVLEAQHQREVVRLHTMWQDTKAELAATKDALRRLEVATGAGERDAAMMQMQSLTVELRDKGRFTELQLAGAREECAKLAESCEDLRHRLSEAQAQVAELQHVQAQQSPLLAELQGACQRLGREKQTATELAEEEHRRLDEIVAAKDQTVALHEHKV